MGRSTTFDRDDVVRAARDVFWARGYGEAGIAELEEATGVKRSSLYHAFGSKKGLFAAVASTYLDDVVRTRIDPLRQADAGPTALADYIREMREAISAGPSGCLLLNAACAPVVDDDPDVRDLVVAYTDELRAAIGAGVALARPDLSAASCAALSEVCSSLVISALAVARVDRDAAIQSLDAVPRTLDAWESAA